MRVRAQIASVFHLDKCIGCHTCSIACKNVWTDRPGTEYMWWNNVETKPGTGYPTLWEDQRKYRGGWERSRGKLRLRLAGRLGELANIFHNPYLPTMDDYYEPWTYKYDDLFSAPASDDQPTARPISMVTGRPMNIEAGPNWDDDLGGSPVYAANDPNFSADQAEEPATFDFARLAFFYLPRICNHCLNPSCVAACPSGAMYKRGEDGIVLVSQEKCRGWRMCVSGCPYKKVYYNWSAGKAEKCILCYPRLETGQAQACYHSCVGRIRYTGVLLYDSRLIEEASAASDRDLVDIQRQLILDPLDPAVAADARDSGVPSAVVEAARKSPVYRYVKEWRLALPLHPEFRTLPMLFYVPPLLPVLATVENGSYRLADDFFSSLDSARVSLRYLARLFTAGEEAPVDAAYRKLLAIRLHRRSLTVGDISPEKTAMALAAAGLTTEQADEIYRLTSLAGFGERFVIPPMLREQAIGATADPFAHREQAGTGFHRLGPKGW